ncbi:MAG TPA: Sapep family Mn(2+)-dependent dipeptidase [Thermoanaerobaculia bacterium]|nr:Sapep family Mn(2+)-dependent dipeptidase [Thermoanaerobaculia bacterium]
MLALMLAATLAANTTQVLEHYDRHESKHLVPMLVEVIRFPTHQFDAEAHAAQKVWLMKAADDLGFVARDAGKVTEIELPGPEGAPVLGLVIHGDVVPAEPDAWSFPPFAGMVENGYVLGRGAADDKGPLIQALLAMKALKESGVARTHTIRLLVGSEEESAASEMAEYLKDHAAPDYSLVLDSEFPVVVGEKAWDGLAITAPLATRDSKKPFTVVAFDAGLAPSIVPDRAEVKLRWTAEEGNWTKFAESLRKTTMPEGTRLVVEPADDTLRIVAYGRSAHAGVNITGGRNALVALAHALRGKLPDGGVDDLLRFIHGAGKDLYGTGFDIRDDDPLWGRYAVNIATVKPKEDDPTQLVLFINLRRTPPRTAAEAKAHLQRFVTLFNANMGARLTFSSELSYFEDEPLGFDPNAKLVRRLMNVYATATGEQSPKPALSGGGTYAKRIPNAIAFGMWFPGKPYPGHDVDEKIAVADLERGTKVLIHALVDIATGEKIEGAFKP